jgi:hypothetical protein
LFDLEPLGFREKARRRGEVAGLMKGVGEGGTARHAESPLAALVAEINRSPAFGDRFL